MRILVVARDLTYPVLDGYQLVTWNMVRELSPQCEFDLLAPDQGCDRQDIEQVRTAFRRVELVRGIAGPGQVGSGQHSRRAPLFFRRMSSGPEAG